MLEMASVRLIAVSERHPLNACQPIVVTDVGSETEVIRVFPLKVSDTAVTR